MTRLKTRLTTPPSEDFLKAKVSTVGLSTLKKWESRCGGWAITEVSNSYESNRYLVIKRVRNREGNRAEYVVARRRQLRPALKALTIIMNGCG